MATEGHSAAEIAAVLGESPNRIERVARRKKIKLAGAGGRRRITYGIRRRHYRTLEELAVMAQVSRAVMAERVMASCLDRGIRAVMKDLGKEAAPKRRYRPRTSKAQAEVVS